MMQPTKMGALSFGVGHTPLSREIGYDRPAGRADCFVVPGGKRNRIVYNKSSGEGPRWVPGFYEVNTGCQRSPFRIGDRHVALTTSKPAKR